MSIYSNSGHKNVNNPTIQEKNTKQTNTNRPKTMADKYKQTQHKKTAVVSDKNLKTLIQKMKNPPKSAKHLLHDSNEEIIGVISSQGEPILFDDSQIKDIKNLLSNEEWFKYF